MNGGSNLTQAGACAVGHTNPGFNQQFPGSDDGKNRTVLRLKTMVSAVPSSHHPLSTFECTIAFAICEWVKMGYPQITRKNTLDDLLGAVRLMISYT